MYVIGIDGGGTKTVGVIADETGKVVAVETVGPTNINSVGEEEAKVQLKQLLIKLQKHTEQKITQVFAGLSGVHDKKREFMLTNYIESLIDSGIQVKVDNDAIIALYSGTLGQPGIVQISGTGSITYGVNEKNKRARVGGWGYLISDEGSGYALGREALSASFRAMDGLAPSTLLTEYILKKANTETLSDLIPMIYQKRAREFIASLSQVVTKAAEQGDQVASHIIKEQSLEMGKSIHALYRKLFEKEATVPVTLTGGVFSRADLFVPYLKYYFRENQLSVSVRVPEIPPVAGAVIGALKEGYIAIDQRFQTVFVQNYKSINLNSPNLEIK